MADFEMRVQFQDHEPGRKNDNTLGEAIKAAQDPGVTIEQLSKALDSLLDQMKSAKWIGKKYHSSFKDAVTRVKKKAAKLPKDGFNKEGCNIKPLQETFDGDGKIEYRVDVENLRGHNLRA